MATVETGEEYDRHKFNCLSGQLKRELEYFDVFRLEEVSKQGSALFKYKPKDFYMISLIRGSSRYHDADKSVEISGTTLTFFNPRQPYVWESLPDNKTGFCCIFKAPFFTEKMKGNVNTLPMFKAGGKPAYFLKREQDNMVSGIFTRMLEEIPSDYLYKYDLLRNYVMELIHFALKMDSSVNSVGKSRNKIIAMENNDKYVGIWITADGYIRHELLPGGRYDEARGSRKSAYQGKYWLTGDHIDYKDDTGFTADGDFRDGILYHAGMVLYREEKK